MPIPHPQLKIDELIETLSEFHWQKVMPDPFTLRRYKAEIVKLLEAHVAPERCYLGLGLLAFIQGNRDDCYDNFEKAMKLAPAAKEIAANYSFASVHFGDSRKAMMLSLDLLRVHPASKSVIMVAIMRCYHAFHFDMAIKLLGRHEELAMNEPSEPIVKKNYLTLMANKLQENKITEVDMLQRLETAVGAIRAQNYEVHATDMLALEDGSSFRRFYIDAQADVCAEINFKIAESLSESYEDTGMEVCSIICRPMQYFNPEVTSVNV